MKPLFVISPLKCWEVGAQLNRHLNFISKDAFVFERPVEPLHDAHAAALIDPTPNPLTHLGVTRLKPRRGKIRAAIALDDQGLLNAHLH